MREVPCVLQAAPPEAVQAEHLPVVPEWWPLDRPGEDPYTPDQRLQLRRSWQLAEARRGPWDGNRGGMLVGNVVPPQLMVPQPSAPGFVYRLDVAASNDQLVIYRYSPADSPGHAEAMRAVEAAFADAYPGYVEQARTEAPQSQGITMERIS